MAALCLAGCAALPREIALEPQEASVVRGASITVTRQRTPGFIFATPASALVNSGMFRWRDPEQAITWGLITSTHNVPDFTEEVLEAFLDSVADNSAARLTRSDELEPWKDSADFSRLAGRYQAEYVLEIRTMNGIFGYGPLSWNTYRMNYFAEAVLVRMSDFTPVWKASCQARAEDENPLTLPGKDFLYEDGALLRAAAAYATKTCGEQLAAAFRSI